MRVNEVVFLCVEFSADCGSQFSLMASTKYLHLHVFLCSLHMYGVGDEFS